MAVLAVEGLRLTRPGPFEVTVARLHVAAAERVAIIGPSGSGKSTVLDLLACVLRPDAADRFDLGVGGGVHALGAMWARGDRAGLRALRGRHMGYVLQSGGLVPFLSLAANVALPLVLAGRGDPARVAGLVERLGIAGVAARRPGSVSVGQRQRAAIARALAHRPGLVLADEPTAALDPATADAVMALLAETAAAQGAALVIVTHDAALARAHGFDIVACAPRPGGMILARQ